MLTTISILTSLSIGIFYPLCFLIHARSPIKDGFHRFHLGMPLVVGGLAFVYLLTIDVSNMTKFLLVMWFVSLTLTTFIYWKREHAKPDPTPSLVGLLAFARTLSEFLGNVPVKGNLIVISVLAGLVLCASLHSMMLGHHYLNVRGLPIKHLKNATYVFWGLLGLRILWDVCFLFYGKVLYEGDQLPILYFSMRLDGFFLWIGILFGTIIPFVALFFVREILKLKNTQAATGILYVVLCSVLMGDLTYRYYWVKFGVAL